MSKNVSLRVCLLYIFKVYLFKVYLGGSAGGTLSDMALYAVGKNDIKKIKLSGELPTSRQEFAMCSGELIYSAVGFAHVS